MFMSILQFHKNNHKKFYNGTKIIYNKMLKMHQRCSDIFILHGHINGKCNDHQRFIREICIWKKMFHGTVFNLKMKKKKVGIILAHSSYQRNLFLDSLFTN